ncbi:hypothetical protein AYO45_06870, partial [Gammaproteobacteria bacterium SCGC AG-212-F23]
MGKRTPFIIGFILVAITVWLQITPIDAIKQVLLRLEQIAYDVQLRAKTMTHKSHFDTVVAVVDIDDKSLLREGQWPWPRAKLAALVTQLQKAGTTVVAFDSIFSEKEPNIAHTLLQEISTQKLNFDTPAIKPFLEKITPYFNDDAKFAESLKTLDSVLGISFLPTASIGNDIPKPLMVLNNPLEQSMNIVRAQGVLNNIPELEKAAKSGGFVNVFSDQDGIIRRVPLLLRYQNNLYPSLALEAVRLYLLGKIELQTASYGDTQQLEGVKIGGRIIPTDSASQVLVPFRGGSFTMPYYSATDVLHNTIPKNALENKIVFVGTSATGLGDLKATAVQNPYPGVEIHATVADGILQNTFSYKPAWTSGAETVLTLILGITCALLFPFLGPRFASIIMLGLPILLFFANAWLWNTTGLIISILLPILLVIFLAIFNIIYGYLFETRRREQLKQMFGQYVPEEHINQMLESKGNYGMLGDDREMTVLFADIRNFTTLSEPLSAAQLKEMLNEFFTPMTEIIFKNK